MNKKKITYKEWEEIGKYNYAAKWLRPICCYRLIKEGDGQFRREQYISWPVYCILFIPCHILQALICIWDGGLKEFEIYKRYFGSDWLTESSECFNRAEKVWNTK